MPEYNVYLRGLDNQPEDLLSTFTSLDFVSRFNRPGSWKMTGEGTCPFTAGRGLIVSRDGNWIFSGQVDNIKKDMSGSTAITRTWEASGIDDLGRLAYRIAHTDPVNLTTNTYVYDTRTGSAETVIKNYVNYNCGPNAVLSRRFSNFVISASGGKGLTITGNARYFNLLEYINSLAILGGGLGIQVVYNASKQLEFQTFEPVDLSDNVKFSADFGNLEAFTYKQKAPKSNCTLVLGQGSGTSRSAFAAGDNTSISTWGLIESLKDQRNEPDSAKLSDWANADLAKNQAQEGYSVTPQSIGQVGFIYSVDYGLGSLVTVADNNIALVQRVTEASFTLDQNGDEVFKPVVGNIPITPMSNVFDRIENAEERLDQIENTL